MLNNRSLAQLILGFESNRLRPLSEVLRSSYVWNELKQKLSIENFDILKQVDWPSEATHIHIAIATAVWNYTNDSFSADYSSELIFSKNSGLQAFNLSTTSIQTDGLVLTFLFLGFAKQERKKYRMLHRKFNTCTVISCK